MFREIILPIFKSTRLCPTACSIMHPRCCRPQAGNFVGALIINKPLLLHLVGCLYYLYQWCTVKQISDNEMYLLIKYIKSVLWRAAKCLSYIEEARCLKVNSQCQAPAVLPTGKRLGTIVQETGWAPAPFWTGAENLAPTGIRSPDRPSRSESLYRLIYPDPLWRHVVW